MKPRALDLFCCGGGATRGLQLAGFHVTGVDHKPQRRYIGDHFVQADALRPPFDLRSFDFIWASPPCQAHSVMRYMTTAKKGHLDLIPETRAMLIASGVPYCIENVIGAPLRTVIELCGTMFDLCTPCGAELRRHRRFETSFMMLQPECRHGFAKGEDADVIGVFGHGPWHSSLKKQSRTIRVYGEGAPMAGARTLRTITITGSTPQQNVERNTVRRTYTVDDARAAMGMPWATMAVLSQAIPPAYAEYIGRAAMRQISGDGVGKTRP